jgi:Flp pilus assembly protein TadD
MVERMPDSSGLNNNLGEILRQRGRSAEAEPFYKMALELDPDNVAPYGNLGILQAERKQFTEAEKTFRALLARSTGNARLRALVNLANVCGEQGKLDEAESLLRQALALAPNHPQVANSFASFLADHQLKLDEALALATRAVQSAPNDANFLDTLGWVQAQRGDYTAAERTLQRALGLAGQEPPTPEIRKHLQQAREKKPPTTNQLDPK